MEQAQQHKRRGVLYRLRQQPLRGKSLRAHRNRAVVGTAAGMGLLGSYLALRSTKAAEALFHPTGYLPVYSKGTIVTLKGGKRVVQGAGKLALTRTGKPIRLWVAERPVNASEAAGFGYPGGSQLRKRIVSHMGTAMPTTRGRFATTFDASGNVVQHPTWIRRARIRIDRKNFPVMVKGKEFGDPPMRYFHETTPGVGKGYTLNPMLPEEQIITSTHPKTGVETKHLVRPQRVYRPPVMIHSVPYVTREYARHLRKFHLRAADLLEGTTKDRMDVRNPLWRIPGARQGISKLEEKIGQGISKLGTKATERIAMPNIPKAAFEPGGEIYQAERNYLRRHRLAARDVYRNRLMLAEKLAGEQPGFVHNTHRWMMVRRKAAEERAANFMGPVRPGERERLAAPTASRMEKRNEIMRKAKELLHLHMRDIALEDVGEKYPSLAKRAARGMVRPLATKVARGAHRARRKILSGGRRVGLEIPVQVIKKRGSQRARAEVTTIQPNLTTGYTDRPTRASPGHHELQRKIREVIARNRRAEASNRVHEKAEAARKVSS